MTKEEKQYLIDAKEKISRDFFRAYMKKNGINKSKEMHVKSSFDFGIQSGATFYMCEVKARLKCTTNISLKYGPYLEKIKLDGMMAEKEKIEKETGKKINMLYFNFDLDGLLIYELVDKYNWITKKLPKDDIDKTIIDKQVVELFNPIEQINYKLNNNYK